MQESAPSGNAINVTVAAGVGVNILTTTQKSQATSSQCQRMMAVPLNWVLNSVHQSMDISRVYVIINHLANTGTHIGPVVVINRNPAGPGYLYRRNIIRLAAG